MGDEKMKRKKRKPPPSKYASVYYDVHHPAAFTGSARKLAAAVPEATIEHARKWLSTQDSYTLHKYARKRFAHPQIYVEAIDSQWSADLIDVQHLAPSNDGSKYILMVVNTLSKFAWAKAIPDKTSGTVAAALASIFRESGRVPTRLRSDKGKEFLGTPTQTMLERYGVAFFTADNYTKASIVERWNRSLRGRLYRYFRATNTERYVDVLQAIVTGYNGTVHSSTGMKPEEVTEYNQHEAWQKLYGHLLRKKASRPGPPSFDVGDSVRISKAKALFEQGYKTSWSKEIFLVRTVHLLAGGAGYKYKIEDREGEEILGTFQKEELQKVKIVPKEIRKVVKRSSAGKYVTWRGFPQSLKTWIRLE